MKKNIIFLIILTGVLIMSCSKPAENPFFTEYQTPFQTPPLDKIHEEHYLPAFKKGIEEHNAEIQAIVENTEAPSFANTIEALEHSGKLLTKVSNVFYNILSANTTDSLQSIAKKVSPLLSGHSDDILLNEKLFQRIQVVHENRTNFNLDAEQDRLLDEYYKEFTRNGANLNKEDKEKLRQINKELSLLTLTFGEHVLKENNRFEMVIDNKDDLAGLPENVIKAASETAKERGHEGKWVFTLHKPSLIPFLQYSAKRKLREKMLKGYIERGNHNDELDNKAIIQKIVSLRIQRANLLGYPSHAAYVLDDNMAKTPQNVYRLLDEIWEPALKRAKAEAYDLQKMIDKEGKNFRLQPWDWWYYAEKVKKEKYALEESQLRPYFKLENVRRAAFETASKLYGITFEKRSDIPVYHPDVEVFEVKDSETGAHIGILYTDYFPRASKRGGAWMNAYRKQYRENGENITPIICNVCNFTKPTEDQPSLLSVDEVSTLFHEFGHALHGLLSNCHYEKLSGTSVARDFVELFSQFNENWAFEPEVMKKYFVHYQTGEPIPDELIEKIKKSAHFNQGFATVEYLAAAYLDMDWHVLKNAEEAAQIDVLKFENNALKKIGLMPEIVVRYRSPYFRHIFAGGYSAGYYSYIWSEVLDADAFEAFKERGLWNPEVAKSFKENLLSRGGTDDPMVLYKKFRGKEPSTRPLLKRRGLL